MAHGTKPGVVIVGAGLAGSILAFKLCEQYAVTIVDVCDTPAPLPTVITETGVPSRLALHAGAGFGGTTSFWANGLIEIEDQDYSAWPVTKSELAPYVAQSFALLGGVQYRDLVREEAALRALLVDRGLPGALLGKLLFCPRVERNVWNHLGLPRPEMECIIGTARHFDVVDGTATAVCVDTASGPRRIEGDMFVICAGGLSSPALVSATAQHAGLDLPAIGRYYHDHPMCWIGEITLGIKLYDVWNYAVRAIDGALRLPFVTRVGDTRFAFYLRTQELRRHHSARAALRELRSAPMRWRNYARLAANWRAVLEVLSFRLGIELPTSTFALLMIAEQPPDDSLTLSTGPDGSIVWNWTLPPGFPDQVERALEKLIAALGRHVVMFTRDADWREQLHTGAHHSGGCRMAASADRGVCDRDLEVFGTTNLWVCDGSSLPSSGYANTGLMIGALALRLADHLLEQGVRRRFERSGA